MPKNFTDIQLQYVAHGQAMGLEPKQIQKSAGLSKHMYEKLLARKDVDEHQLTVYDTYLTRAESRSALVTLRHQSEVESMVPAAYNAIQHALEDVQGNSDLAVRTAKWLLQQAGGAPLVPEEKGAVAATQVNVYASEKSQAAVEGFIESVAKTTSELMTEPLPHVNAPSKHVHVSEAEVVRELSADDHDPLDEAGG